ncbi:MAG: DUF202 domain-containing protein [Gemmatimonadota bacterium]
MGTRGREPAPAGGVRLGLRENAGQFALLVLVNALVGAMVGVERSVLPLLAESEFGIASASAAMSFLAAFGVAKSAANYLAGDLAGRVGRRRILLAGWLLALPVPLLLTALSGGAALRLLPPGAATPSRRARRNPSTRIEEPMSEDPRARLAYDRTLLANERTFAAWLRTGLSVAAVGLAVAHLAALPGESPELPVLLGGGFVLVGIAILAFGAWRFTRVNRDLAEAGSPSTDVRPGLVYAVTAVVGALLLSVLLVL